MVSAIGVSCRIVGRATVRVFEANPLNRRILGSIVNGLVLGGIGDREDIAERIIGAVDLVEAIHSSGAPDVDNGVAGARKKKGPIVREEKAHDAALVRLDAVNGLEVSQRPDEYLAILSTGIYLIVADDESENRAIMLEGVDKLRSRVRRDFDDGQWCGRAGHGGHVAYEVLLLVSRFPNGISAFLENWDWDAKLKLKG